MDGLIIGCGVAALIVRIGMALFGTGMVRSKNAAGEAMRSVCDLCLTALAFWAVGAAILQQHRNDWFGINPRLLFAASDRESFLYTAIVLIGTGIVPGVVAERSRFRALCVSSILLSAVLIPVIGNWVWSGWLNDLGFMDVAGASVLHVTCGLYAAVAAIFIGARMGKYNRDGSSNAIPGHNVALSSMGVLLMLVGWFPYVLGATIMHAPPVDGGAAMNVLLAGVAGALVSLMYGRFRYGKPEIFLTYSGLLGGLVAISAAGGVVSSLAAVIIGAVAGLLIPTAILMLDLRWHIDDPSGGIAIHGVGGIWGILAVAIFTRGSFVERCERLGVQALGLVAIIVVVGVFSVALFKVMKALGPIRVSEEQEFDGLDLAEHDLNAYPDFQQTMIKSYHLREA